MKQRVWVETSCAPSDAAYFAAPTRGAARQFIADESGCLYIEVRVAAVRHSGLVAGRGYRGPQAVFDGEPGWMSHEQVMAAMPTLRWCETCERYWPRLSAQDIAKIEAALEIAARSGEEAT